MYYVLADLVMLSLYFYYKFKNRPSLCEYGGPRVSYAGGSREQVPHGWVINLGGASSGLI